MLTNLRITNYALIANIDISFGRGFSVITGETGAGKSIILGALGLVLGQRADTKAIREGSSKCIIEADFNIEGYKLEPFFEQNNLDYSISCTIRREVSSNGKSRIFVNDTPIGLAALKELGNKLIDIHSQHENLKLGNDDFQRDIIDRLANNELQREQYAKAYDDYVNAKQTLDNLKQKAKQEQADQDYIEFQLKQLTDAKLRAGEEQELETEITTLSHAEEIKLQLSESNNRLSSEHAAVDLMREAEQYLARISRFNTAADELQQRLKSTIIELRDIADTVDDLQRSIDYDPQRLQQAEERFDMLNTLMAKHHVDSSVELIKIREELNTRLGQINSFDEQIHQAEKQYKQRTEILETQAKLLTNSRLSVKSSVEKQIINLLLQLGIKHAQFDVRFEQLNDFTLHGTDLISFMFAANKNQSLQDVASVASGGEIARIMLAIKSITADNNLDTMAQPTLLFDEIDTGVSGEIADCMGQIMSDMSKSRQIISITHLPQIAARGEIHYKVFKQDNDISTETHISCLQTDERISEIAAMLSGNHITEAAIANAKELLTLHR